MFLDVLRRRNPKFIEAAIALHREGKIPANAYVLDLDTVEANARLLKTEADRLGMKIFAMTKQVGRASSFSKAVMRGGIDRSVAVDMACARATHRAGLKVGHLGHLQQVARHEAKAAAATFQPDYLDRFQRNQGWRSRCRAPPQAMSRTCWPASRPRAIPSIAVMKAASRADDVAAVADAFDRLKGGRFAGITTFPALLFDHADPQGAADA
jgi:hypothetical protein